MGATTSLIPLLMAGLFISVGIIVGGFGWNTIDPGAGFNPVAGNVGGIFGLLMAVVFGFISILYISVIIIWVVFSYFILRR